MKKVTIACGQGFWGDWLEAPVRQVRGGHIDYMVLDYLAEVTMSILTKQRRRDPNAGYARDFVDTIERILPDILERNIKVVANAGGVNPMGCALAVHARAKKLGLDGKLAIAVISGDDISDRIETLLAAGETFENIDDGRKIQAVQDNLRSANVYFGSDPIVAALAHGAQVIITGRVADASLALGPMRHELSWKDTDWNLLASGIVAGHIIECGAQASGGNCSVDWQSIPDLANIGYPLVEVAEDGSFVVTKHPGTGGRIDLRTIKEQLVYEIGDPTRYIVPEVVADFTSCRLSQDGENRVRVSNVTGTPRTDFLKVSMSYFAGYTAFGTMVYSWPNAYAKAKAAGAIITERLSQLGLKFDRVHTEIIGGGACHGAQESLDLPEVMLRVAARGPDEAALQRFTREIAPLVLSGPPSATAYGGGKRQVQEVIAYWPALVARTRVVPNVDYI